MTESISRRHALLSLAGALAAVPATQALAAAPAAAAKPRVSLKEPTALALAYFEDASKVDAKKYPTYKPGQTCENCLQITGKDGEAWRPCNLFPGKLVASKGWCKVYIKKP